jgi:hypothetical protein
MALTKRLSAEGIKAYGVAPPGLRLGMPVTEGPARTVGRTVEVHLSDDNVESVITFLLEREDWRERLRLIMQTTEQLAAEAVSGQTNIARKVALGHSYFASTLQAELRKLRAGT